MVFKGKVNRSIESDSEIILSTDYYLHKTIMQSIEAPFKSLENNSFGDGLKAVQLAGYLTQKLASSNGTFIKDSENDLKDYLEEEKKKLIAEKIEEDSEAFKSMLAYSKICWILKLVEGNKPNKSEYKV